MAPVALDPFLKPAGHDQQNKRFSNRINQ